MCILTYKTVTEDTLEYLTNMIASASASAYRMRSDMRNSLDVPRTLNWTRDSQHLDFGTFLSKTS